MRANESAVMEDTRQMTEITALGDYHEL